jgi:hypothetical protein
MKAYSGMEVLLLEFFVLALYLDDDLHAVAALSPGLAPLVLIALLGLRACLDTLERRKMPCPRWESNPVIHSIA